MVPLPAEPPPEIGGAESEYEEEKAEATADLYSPRRMKDNTDNTEEPLSVESSEVRKTGRSTLVITLTHPLKDMGCEVGDPMKVLSYPDKIIIIKDELQPKGKTRVAYVLDTELWNAFDGNIEEAVQTHITLTQGGVWSTFKEVVLAHEKDHPAIVLRRLAEDHISKWKKWTRILDRPILNLKF